jgi:hypothetical protein
MMGIAMSNFGDNCCNTRVSINKSSRWRHILRPVPELIGVSRRHLVIFLPSPIVTVLYYPRRGGTAKKRRHTKNKSAPQLG